MADKVPPSPKQRVVAMHRRLRGKPAMGVWGEENDKL